VQAKGDLIRPCVKLNYTRTCHLDRLIQAIQMVLCLCFLLQGSQVKIGLVVVLETMQHPGKTVLVIVLETMQYPVKLAAYNLLQKCSLLCGRKLSRLSKLCFNDLGMLVKMLSAMKNSCEKNKIMYEKTIHICCICIYMLHRTPNNISSVKLQQEPEIFFIKTVASYIFFYSKFESQNSYYSNNIFKTLFTSQKVNLFAQESNTDITIYVLHDSSIIISMCEVMTQFFINLLIYHYCKFPKNAIPGFTHHILDIHFSFNCIIFEEKQISYFKIIYCFTQKLNANMKNNHMFMTNTCIIYMYDKNIPFQKFSPLFTLTWLGVANKSSVFLNKFKHFNSISLFFL